MNSKELKELRGQIERAFEYVNIIGVDNNIEYVIIYGEKLKTCKNRLWDLGLTFIRVENKSGYAFKILEWIKD